MKYKVKLTYNLTVEADSEEEAEEEAFQSLSYCEYGEPDVSITRVRRKKC